jgi:hypothetical protein
MGVLNALSGNRGQLALDYANQAIPMPEEANKYEAALRFFLEMGKQASQPGSTVLGSAFGAGQAPLDYLTAKNAEIRKAKQARASLGLQIAPSLKPKAVAAKTTYRPATADELKQYGAAAGQMDSLGRFYDLSKTTGTGSTYKEQKFYKIGQDAAVIKNPTDAALFQDDGWVTVPPEGWKPPADSVDAAEVKSSKILDGGVVVSILTDNTVTVRNGLGELLPEGQNRADAIRIAEDRGIEIQGNRAGARRAATFTVDMSRDNFTKVGRIRENITNLDEARRLVAEEGATTGYLASFLPDWKASTIALRQVQRELGLDVVGSVTFGALSQEELTLALRVALPETMAGPDLIDWIDRKKDAQQKLSAYLLEQAYFFSEGDTTLKDWKKYKEDEQDAAEEAELEERRQEALRRQSGTNYDFTTMSAAELNEIDVSALTDDQFDAWEKRMDELGL